MGPILKTKTRYGEVEGVPGGNQNIAVYKGVPYAAPPVGPLRFMPPEEPEKWEGVRVCDHFAPISMQGRSMPGLPFTDFFIKEFYPVEYPMSEDSLYLNIWTPARSEDEKLPVLMWFHGGGLASGYSYEMEFDGEALAKKGIIVVTVGFRLNLFGFFAHPELSKRNPHGVSGNNTLLDQLQAMKWVKENIGYFGGDGDSITISGQSGGAAACMAHLASPVSAPYFKQAIIQSGPNGLDTMKGIQPTMAQAEAWGVQACEALGLTLEDLYRLPAEELYEKFEEAKRLVKGFPPCETIDGWFLPYSPSEAQFLGKGNNKPVLAGDNGGDIGGPANDLKMPWYFEDPRAWQVKDACAALGNEAAEKVVKVYPPEDPANDPLYKVFTNAAYLGAVSFANARVKAGQGPNYMYYFNAYRPGGDEFNFTKAEYAYHSYEIWFVFGTLSRCWRNFDGRYYDLTEKIQSYWANFVKYGDPNGEGLAEWPAYEKDSKAFMVLTEEKTESSTALASGEMDKIQKAVFG